MAPTTFSTSQLSTSPGEAVAAQHLDLHLTELSNVWDRVRTLADRIEIVADRMLGAENTDRASSPPVPEPSSVLGKLQVAETAIHTVIGRAESAIKRLERL